MPSIRFNIHRPLINTLSVPIPNRSIQSPIHDFSPGPQLSIFTDNIIPTPSWSPTSGFDSRYSVSHAVPNQLSCSKSAQPPGQQSPCYCNSTNLRSRLLLDALPTTVSLCGRMSGPLRSIRSAALSPLNTSSSGGSGRGRFQLFANRNPPRFSLEHLSVSCMINAEDFIRAR